jgi:hypothetical protein
MGNEKVSTDVVLAIAEFKRREMFVQISNNEYFDTVTR